MHPHMFDAQIHAVADNLVRHPGIRQDEDRIRFGRQRGQVGVTGLALERSEARVDRVDFVPGILEILYAALQPVSRLSETPTTAILFWARKS